MTTLGIGDNTTFQNGSPDSTETGVESNEIKEESPDTVSTSNSFEVTKYSSGFWTQALIRADLSSIPANATINSATLYLYEEGAGSTGGHTISAYPLLRAWVEAQATYNSYATGSSWGTAGALNNTTDRLSALSGTLTTVGTDGFRSLSITDYVQDVVDGTISTDQGLVLERTDGSNDFESARFSADSSSVDGQRPEFYIDYTEATASEAGIEVVRIIPGVAH